MALTRHWKLIFATVILAILLILISNLDSLSSAIRIWSARTTSPHLDFLNITPHSTSHPTNMASPATTYPTPFVHEPTAEHNSTIILLHGTSQNGSSFGEAFLSFPIPINPNQPQTLPQLLPGIRFVFPSGKLRYCTVLGRESHAWFDFVSFADRTLNEESQIEGLSESTKFLAELVKGEAETLDRRYGEGEGAKRMVLGGFSQGAALAYIALLSGEMGKRIGTFVGMSGWCPFRKQVYEAVFEPISDNMEGEDGVVDGDYRSRCAKAAIDYVRRLLDLPPLEAGKGVDLEEGQGIEAVKGFLDVEPWFGHGEDDLKMKIDWGRDMAGLLNEIGLVVTFEEYEGLGHWWNGEEMVDLVGFLRRLWGLSMRQGGSKENHT